jgi:hypothetical protein
MERAMQGSSSPKELCDYVRDRLPLRAKLVGKERICDMVLMAVTEWPIQPLMDCERSSAVEEKILEAIAANVGRTYETVRGSEKRYGFFWAFVLSSVVSAVVQLVLEWWLSRSANRIKMAAWQYGMKGGS